MTILLIPFIYMAICTGMSAILPPVDYKAVSQPTEQPEEKQ